MILMDMGEGHLGNAVLPDKFPGALKQRSRAGIDKQAVDEIKMHRYLQAGDTENAGHALSADDVLVFCFLEHLQKPLRRYFCMTSIKWLNLPFFSRELMMALSAID
jgi:hypothetical protein